MEPEEIQSKQISEVISEMAKARNQRPNSFSIDTYLKAVRNFDPDLVRSVCVELCVNMKKGMPKPCDVKARLKQVLRLRQVRPEDFHTVGPSDYKLNAGFIGMAVRLGLEFGTDRWVRARRKWDNATDFERELWKEKAK